MPPKITEHTEQVRFVIWFRKTYPGVLIFAIPNAGNRTNGIRMVAEGLVAGIPDLFVPAWSLWIEMKLPGGRLSPVQVQQIAYLESIGHRVIIAYGFQEAVCKTQIHMPI